MNLYQNDNSISNLYTVSITGSYENHFLNKSKLSYSIMTTCLYPYWNENKVITNEIIIISHGQECEIGTIPPEGSHFHVRNSSCRVSDNRQDEL